MATCKDCIHYEACYIFEHDIVAYGKNAEKQCIDFKDRSKFIELPCRVNIGDKVWTLDSKDTICTGTVVCIFKDVLGFSIDIGWEICELKNVGKTVFFTKEEAEQALKEREEE